ncbi:hypothetical protein [Microvirga thermotolerans]|uniref:Uncharacterized protein n=1 Tax=Microvirga thermotolerans TaxID=2651334 RepID=A0A5P9JXP5_9HYPH|nr:hypothetical protein [Microvirga thermotolerans]QFU17387.1 hypothetical protein GDR74_14810 [Microvirga thermotolerans]
MRRTPYLISSLLPFLLAMATAAAAQEPRSWFVEQGYVPPAGGRIVACHGYGCMRRTVLPLEEALLRQAGAIMRTGRSSPAAERQALGEVVKLYTSYLARRFGSVPDAPRSPPSLSGVSGQMDCVDEAANTTSLLLVLQDQGLLVHHEVERPQSRGVFIDGRYPHTTAIIAEKRSHAEWAVDPWAKAPGERPDILPLERWRQDS